MAGHVRWRRRSTDGRLFRRALVARSAGRFVGWASERATRLAGRGDASAGDAVAGDAIAGGAVAGDACVGGVCAPGQGRGSRVSRRGASAGRPLGPSARGRCMSGRGDAGAGDASAGDVCVPGQGPPSFLQFFVFAATAADFGRQAIGQGLRRPVAWARLRLLALHANRPRPGSSLLPPSFSNSAVTMRLPWGAMFSCPC